MIQNMMLLSLATFLSASLAWADRMGPNGDKFYEEAAHFENACAEGSCKRPYSKQLLYSFKEKVNLLDVSLRSQILTVANDQTQIWGDTILEGDFYSSGRTRIDSVIAFYKKQTLIGYKIQYSEKAWFTAECQFDGTRETLKNCPAGRIHEGSYVSADMQTYFSDEERHAEFSFDQVRN